MSRWRKPVSPPRSSNRTCGFPASGFPTGFIVRPTATTVCARAEDSAPPTPRRHGLGRTGLCHVLALCAVCAGSYSCGHRHVDRQLHTPRQGRHRRSRRTNHREGGSIAFALPATRLVARRQQHADFRLDPLYALLGRACAQVLAATFGKMAWSQV